MSSSARTSRGGPYLLWTIAIIAAGSFPRTQLRCGRPRARDTGGVPTGNIELARQAIDAMNRRDLDWLGAHSAPDLELHARGVAGEPVLYKGVAGLRENLHDMGEIWESIEHFPEDVREAGDRVVAIVKRRLRGRGSGAEVEDRIGIVWEMRDGLAVQVLVVPRPGRGAGLGGAAELGLTAFVPIRDAILPGSCASVCVPGAA